MSAIETFTFPTTGQDVRAVMVNGAPWVVGRDAATILGHSNTRKAIRDHVPAGHRGGNESFPLADLGLDPQTVLIDEAGLYRLIMRSNTAMAERFQEWVTAEVLPAIRRTGSYAVRELSREDLARMVLEEAAEKKALAAQVAELTPDAERARRTEDLDGEALVSTVAKRFGIREKKLRQLLYREHILIEFGARRNDPRAEYVERGYFVVKTRAVGEPPRAASTTFVTPKGEAFIWRRAYAAGLVSSPRMPGTQLTIIEGGAA